MFGPVDPARDILELFDALSAEGTPAHIYRGQNRFYNPSVASAFRPFVSGIEKDGWVPLISVTERPSSGRRYEADSYKIKTILGQTYDRGIANVLAQQYGLTSDMFDMTASLGIAAFFATREWPSFKPFVPADQETDLGVVYRTRCGPPPDVDTFIRAMERLYALSYETGQKILFDDVHAFNHDAFRDMGPAAMLLAIQTAFPEGAQPIELLKQAFYCHPATIKEVLISKLKAMRMDTDGDAENPLKTLDEIYNSTRIARQAAGLYSSPLRYSGVISKSMRVVNWNGAPDWFKADPPTALHGGVNAVFDLNHNPNFERFYFRHDPEKAVRIDDLNFLWPGVDDDFFFNVLYKISRRFFKDHHGIDNFNPLEGLLDRGYSSI